MLREEMTSGRQVGYGQIALGVGVAVLGIGVAMLLIVITIGIFGPTTNGQRLEDVSP